MGKCITTTRTRKGARLCCQSCSLPSTGVIMHLATATTSHNCCWEGKTGTVSTARALHQLGFKTAHHHKLYCPDPNDCPSHTWSSTWQTMMNLDPSEYASFDFCSALLTVDAISDIPVPTIFPFIVSANWNNSVTILTLRESTSWAQRRFEWALSRHVLNVTNPTPFSWFSLESVMESYRGKNRMNVEAMHLESSSLLPWAYFAEISLVMCLVPDRNLLVLDVFREDDSVMWHRLARFLKVPIPGSTNINKFGLGDYHV